MFIAAQFTIAKIWYQPKCLSIHEWIIKMWYIYIYMEYYSAMEKWVSTFCNNLDGTRDHSSKWSISRMEKQTPHVLTIKLELTDQHSFAQMKVKLSENHAGERRKEGMGEIIPKRYNVHYLGDGYTYNFDSSSIKAIHITKHLYPCSILKLNIYICIYKGYSYYLIFS